MTKELAIPESSPSRKVLNWVLYAAILVMGLTIALLLFWSLSTDEALEIKNQPFPVRTVRPHATADGVVILKIDYCKKIKATGTVRVSFVSNSREVFLPVSEDKQPPQCQNTEIPVLIPHDLSPDTYKIHFRVEYQVNPIKKITQEFDSAKFEVVDG